MTPPPDLLLARCHSAIADAVQRGRDNAVLYVAPDAQAALARKLRKLGYTLERLETASPRGNTRITWR